MKVKETITYICTDEWYTTHVKLVFYANLSNSPRQISSERSGNASRSTGSTKWQQRAISLAESRAIQFHDQLDRWLHLYVVCIVYVWRGVPFITTVNCHTNLVIHRVERIILARDVLIVYGLFI